MIPEEKSFLFFLKERKVTALSAWLLSTLLHMNMSQNVTQLGKFLPGRGRLKAFHIFQQDKAGTLL